MIFAWMNARVDVDIERKKEGRGRGKGKRKKGRRETNSEGYFFVVPNVE